MGGDVSEEVPGLTRALSRFGAAMAETPVPAPLSAIVRQGFTDCIAVMVAGWDEAAPRLVRRTFPARDDRDSAALASIYGSAAHVLDYDDVAFGNHPSVVLVPALLAAAHGREISGARAVRAYVAGYEIWADLARRDADPLHAKGWHPTTSYGVVAAAAAVACAWGLDEPTTLNAIAIAASLTGGVVGNFGSMTKPFQVGRAAQSGIIAAQAALAGMTAAPDVIESRQGLLHALSARGAIDLAPPEDLLELPGLRKYGLNIKLSPICYAAHRIVDAVVELRARYAADGARVAVDRFDVELGDTQSAILREHADARTSAAAKFSAEFAVAATWLAGQCGLAELVPDFIQRPDVRELMSRVVRHPVTARDPIEPMHAPFDRITIVFSDGTRLTSSDVCYPEGHRLRPATAGRLRAKFDSCVVPRVGVGRAADLFELAEGLEGLEDLKVLATAATSGMEDE